MATATLNWVPVGGGFSLSQDIDYKAIDDVGWTFHSNVSASTGSATITGLSDNILYQVRITNLCPEGLTGSSIAEGIHITCPTVFINEGQAAVAFSFDHLGGDITGYVVELLSALNVVLDTKTFSSPGPVVANTFTGLTSSTDYKIRVTPKAMGDLGEHSFVCTPVPFRTDDASLAQSVRLGTSIFTVCSEDTTTVYIGSLEVFGVGVVLYVDPGLTIPVTGYTYVVSPDIHVYEMDTDTGEVTMDTFADC